MIDKIMADHYFCPIKNSLSASRVYIYVAKSSLLHLSRLIALEGSAYKIRSNVVNPDAVIQGSKIWKGDWKKQRAISNKISINNVEEFYKNRSLQKESILPDVLKIYFSLVPNQKNQHVIINVDGETLPHLQGNAR